MDHAHIKIALLLDASGSMDACRDAVIQGFNQFLAEQEARQGAAPATLTVALFNEGLRSVVRDQPLEQVAELAGHQYIPFGGTALLDAIGGLVQGVGAHLSRQPAGARPARVVIAILTDGRVNHSRNYSLERVNYLIRHQREKYAWEFLFLGSQDGESRETAARLGIPSHSVSTYSWDADGIRQAFATLSREITNLRTYRSSFS